MDRVASSWKPSYANQCYLGRNNSAQLTDTICQLLLHFFYFCAKRPELITRLNFNLTFANWIQIVPVTVIAGDRRGTNNCIAIRTIKSHRTPVPEVVSWSPAMRWVSRFATRCCGIQHKQSNQLLKETVFFVWPRIASIDETNSVLFQL